MSFINQLKPVTYNYDIHGLNKFIGIQSGDKNETNGYEEEITKKEEIQYTGFIAQEVEAAAEKINYDFSGIYKPQNEKDPYGLSYSDFVVPLVKSVQELSKQNDEIKSQNENLQQQIVELKQSMSANQASSNDGFAKLSFTASEHIALLGQNIPNPLTTPH